MGGATKAVLGAGLAIAGCFFPPLELAAGASFEAALAASASTAFVAADASLAIGVGLDLAVAEVHPTPANQAVVVGDLVGLALGYGIGKAIGAAVSKFGPAVVEAFAQRAAKEVLPDLVETFQQATFEEYVGSVKDFANGANEELAQQSYQLYKAQNWAELEAMFNKHSFNDGYPPNDGFIATRTTSLLPHPTDPGAPVFDRFGGYRDADGNFKDGGKFVARPEVEFENRALHDAVRAKERHWYSVEQPIPNVKEGEAIPWFGQPGKGMQYKTDAGIDDLIKDGFIKRVK